jgi:hypothetical protein
MPTPSPSRLIGDFSTEWETVQVFETEGCTRYGEPIHRYAVAYGAYACESILRDGRFDLVANLGWHPLYSTLQNGVIRHETKARAIRDAKILAACRAQRHAEIAARGEALSEIIEFRVVGQFEI